ncbi:MAG: hypothetical protein V3W20_05095 [Candidatus Neomarinimicrobiota bacterium]
MSSQVLQHTAGLNEGDRIIYINRNCVNDEIDLIFYSQEPYITLVLDRNGEIIETVVEKEEYEHLGVQLESFKIKQYNNNFIGEEQ